MNSMEQLKKIDNKLLELHGDFDLLFKWTEFSKQRDLYNEMQNELSLIRNKVLKEMENLEVNEKYTGILDKI